ncbi:MAG: sulfurtransferase [Erythrobacter sp.]
MALATTRATDHPMNEDTPDLVSTRWLADRMVDDNRRGEIIVLDASVHLPAAERDARSEFKAAHIPGARFLDLASLTDKTSPVPAALPRPEQLSARLSELGVSRADHIVLYDDSAIATSSRAWFMCRASGIERVSILGGGLRKWRREGQPLESGTVTPDTSSDAPRLHPAEGVATKQDLLANLEEGSEQVVDARGADRVFGTGTDPVHGVANGRIPGARNLPYGKVFDEDGTFKSPEKLRAAFEAAGIDWQRPVVTTCGSGVTASVLLFAMHLAGKNDVRLYDGSWLEWSADPATPKAEGPE